MGYHRAFIDSRSLTARMARPHQSIGGLRPHASPIIACTRWTSAGSSRTLRGFVRCWTSSTFWWRAGSAAINRLRARRNLSVRSRSGGRCPSVSEKARSGTAADAHGVSISPAASAKKEGGREPGERVAFSAPEQTQEQQRLLSGHAHALAVYRVEAANGVGKRKQAARERFEPLEVPPDARREAEADDVIEQFGVPDRVVQRRRPELLGEGQEPSASPGGLSSCRPPRVTIHLPPSSGNINAPRCSPGYWGASASLSNRMGRRQGWRTLPWHSRCRRL